MRKLRLRERDSEITPQTLVPGLFALIIEFHCEEENSIKYKHATNQPTNYGKEHFTRSREIKRLRKMNGVLRAGFCKHEAERTESTCVPPRPPARGVQGASAAGFKGALALAAPTTTRRQSNADAGSLKSGWDRRRGLGNQPRAPTQGL